VSQIVEFFWIVLNPPIPEPEIIPNLFAIESSTFLFSLVTKPLSIIASKAAFIPNWINLSAFLTSFLSITVSGSKFFTSPAIWTEKSVVSNSVILSIPQTPFTTASKDSFTLCPVEFIVPNPVITTLFI
jgi:hypothetical protein